MLKKNADFHQFIITLKRLKEVNFFRYVSSDLTNAELRVRFIILHQKCQHNEEALSIKKLSTLLNIKNASTIQLINALEKHGYIIRQSSTTDKRITYVVLTEKGESLVKLIHEANETVISTLMEKFGAEMKQTFLSLNKILDELETIPIQELKINNETI